MNSPDERDIMVEYDTQRRMARRIKDLEAIVADLQARIEALEENVTPPEQSWLWGDES